MQVDETPDEGVGAGVSGYNSSSGDEEGAESCPICLLRLRSEEGDLEVFSC